LEVCLELRTLANLVRDYFQRLLQTGPS
jgi:hypothetical protein